MATKEKKPAETVKKNTVTQEEVDVTKLPGYEFLRPLRKVTPSKYVRLEERVAPVLDPNCTHGQIADLLEFVEENLVVDEDGWIEYAQENWSDALNLVITYWNELAKKGS